MLRLLQAAASLAAILACVGTAAAQFDVNGPNAALTIQNLAPSTASPVTHFVDVAVPGDLDIDITAGSNPPQGLILITAPVLTAAAFGVPWGGSIDIGTPNPPGAPLGIQVVVDSVFYTTNPALSFFAATPFNLSLSLPVGLAGASGPAIQALVSDPTAPPFYFDNTEAGAFAFKAQTVTVYSTLGDDAFTQHFCDQVGGPSPVNITYGGTVYTNFYIGSNGAVTFNTGSTTFNTTMARFFAGFQAAPTTSIRPGIGVLWTDLNPSAFAGTDNVTIVEDRALNTVQIQYNNQEYWNSVLPAGSCSVTCGLLGAGSLYFDYTNLIGGDPTQDAGPIIGVTDGTSTLGTDRISDLSADIAASYVGMSRESIAEDFSAYLLGVGGTGQPLDIGTFAAIDIGNGGSTPYFTWSLF